MDTEVPCYVIDGGLYGGEAGALAAARAADCSESSQDVGRKLRALSPLILREGSAGGDDGIELASADGCTAYAPVAAGSARHLKAAASQLGQSRIGVDVAACVLVSSQQYGTHERMMLGTIGVDAMIFHDLLSQLDGIAAIR